MKIRKVSRYYCDWCGKGGCGCAAMKKHERHCTMNPSRECRMCIKLGLVQKPMPELIAVLPDPAAFTTGFFGSEVMHTSEMKLDEALKRLREVSNDCPACILAALRLRGIPPGAAGFEYVKEAKAAMNEADSSLLDREQRDEVASCGSL